MKRIKQSIRVAVALALLCMVALPSSAFQTRESPVALGADGTLLRLLDGAYGDLFPDGAAARESDPVLALEIVAPGGESVRFIVPGTENADEEDSAILVLDDPSGAVYLLWETKFNGLHPLLRLARFADGSFSEVLDITSGPFADKGDPQLLITRESAMLAEQAEDSFPVRTLVHVAWWQEGPAVSRKLYAPILISGDSFVPPAVLDLSSFLSISGDFEPAAIDQTLENLLVISPGADQRSIIAGFLDPDRHRLVTLRIEALPLPLTALGDKIPAEIVIIGRRAVSLPELADEVGHRVYELGWAFHESSRTYIAEHVRRSVAGANAEDLSPEFLAALGDRVRQEILAIGSAIDINGLSNPSVGQILALDQAADAEGLVHALRVTVVSDREAPNGVGSEGRARLFVSRSGQHALVAWEGEGQIYFQESLELGWGEVGVVELRPEIDRESIYRMFQDRISSR